MTTTRVREGESAIKWPSSFGVFKTFIYVQRGKHFCTNLFIVFVAIKCHKVDKLKMMHVFCVLRMKMNGLGGRKERLVYNALEKKQ
jgi:hypothetical protein